MKYKFSSSKYTAVHGKTPNGFGFWIFWTPKAPQEVVASGSLSEAKRIASQKLRALGVEPCTVYIMP